MSDQPDVQTSTKQHATFTREDRQTDRQTTMLLAQFEPTIRKSEWLQSYAVYCSDESKQDGK